MKDYRQIVSESYFSDFCGLKEEDRDDYRWSFLMGIDILLDKMEDRTFRILPCDYPDASYVPSLLLSGGELVESSVQLERSAVPGMQAAPSLGDDCVYRLCFTYRERGAITTKSYDQTELSVEEVFSIFAFLYGALDDGEYKDIDEFYGYELS